MYTMECIECVICLNDISNNDHFTLTCCKNNIHIYCLNDWIKQNITKKNISRCFICSQENSMIESIVGEIIENNSIINSNNNINRQVVVYNELIMYNDTNSLDIAYVIDKRLFFLYNSIKACFFIFVSSLVMLVIYYIS